MRKKLSQLFITTWIFLIKKIDKIKKAKRKFPFGLEAGSY